MKSAVERDCVGIAHGFMRLIVDRAVAAALVHFCRFDQRQFVTELLAVLDTCRESLSGSRDGYPSSSEPRRFNSAVQQRVSAPGDVASANLGRRVGA